MVDKETFLKVRALKFLRSNGLCNECINKKGSFLGAIPDYVNSNCITCVWGIMDKLEKGKLF